MNNVKNKIMDSFNTTTQYTARDEVRIKVYDAVTNKLWSQIMHNVWTKLDKTT